VPQHGRQHCRLYHWRSSRRGQWRCTPAPKGTADTHTHFHFLLHYFHHLCFKNGRDFISCALITSHPRPTHTLEKQRLTDVKEVHVIPIVSVLHFTGHHPKGHDLAEDQYVWFAGVHLDLWVIALVGQSISCHCKQVPEVRNDPMKISKAKNKEIKEFC
jgi:hypothetical protein